MSGAKNSFWNGCRNWLKDGLEIREGGSKMTVKDIAMHLTDTLPDDATMDDVIHALYINEKFSHVWITGVVHGVRNQSPE